jgi:ABC-type transporter Mla subunit MlaD
LGDTTLGTDLKRTLAKTETTIDGLNSMINTNAGDIAAIVADLRFATGNIKTLLSENHADISAMIQNMNTVIANVEKLTKESQNLPADMNKIVADLKKFTASLDKKDTAFGLMFNSPEFGAQLTGTLNALDSLVNKIDEHGINANIRLGGRP